MTSKSPVQSLRAVADVSAGAATLLDVRRDDEWKSIRAVGAFHWPLERLRAGEMPPVATDVKIYIYCAAGGRAGIARDLLRAHGYADVTSIGGLSEWQRAGGEIE